MIVHIVLVLFLISIIFLVKFFWKTKEECEEPPYELMKNDILDYYSKTNSVYASLLDESGHNSIMKILKNLKIPKSKNTENLYRLDIPFVLRKIMSGVYRDKFIRINNDLKNGVASTEDMETIRSFIKTQIEQYFKKPEEDILKDLVSEYKRLPCEYRLSYDY